MAKVVGEVAIDVLANVGPLVKGFDRAGDSMSKFENSAVSMARKLGSAMGIGALSIGAAATAMAGMTKAAMNNIDTLSKQARALGVSVSAFQAMALVANEAGVETDNLSKMLVRMQDSISGLADGLTAQVDVFEKLNVSMADLRGLSADEQFKVIAEAINGISDPAAKTAAALDIFGKSGSAAVNMLDGYASAVSNAEQFQRQFGIAVSDTDAQNIEKANDAVGRMSLALSGLGNVLAVEAAPAVTAFSEAVVGLIGTALSAETALAEMFGSVERAKTILGEDLFEQLMQSRGAVAEASDELVGLIYNWEEVQRAVATATSSMSGDIGALLDAGAVDLALQLEEVTTNMDQLALAYNNGTIEGEEFTAKMQQATTQAIALLTEANAIDGIDLSSAIGTVERLSGALAVAVGNARAVVMELANIDVYGAPFPGKDSDDAAIDGPVGQFAPGTSPRPKSAPVGDWYLPEVKGGGGGGGGGGADKFEQRITALVESLQTEREIIDAWYQENLALIQEATDAELAAVGGKHEALERLEEEHQRRLSDIKEAGNQWSLQSALSGGAEILGAMGSFNKKALKLQAVFSAGQALISTYEGAAKELRKGTFGFATAAAVIAKGLAFVGAIKSAGSGGGGGGATAAGAASAAQAQQPMQVSLNTYGVGDMIRTADFGSILDRLNTEAGDRGYQLMWRPS